MVGRRRIELALSAAAVLLAALAGCGGGHSTTVVVARVRGDAITKAELTRAMTAVAPGPVPDPPRYARCVDRLSGLALKGETTAVLRINCEQEYRAIVQQALDFLISSQWTIDEASDRALRVSAGEVQAQMRDDRSARSSSDPRRGNEALAAHAELSAELLRRMLAAREPARGLPAQLRERRRRSALARFVASWRRRWTARTSCAAGYVVDDCRGYAGFRPPKDPLAFE